MKKDSNLQLVGKILTLGLTTLAIGILIKNRKDIINKITKIIKK